jgi:hypothetical protein
LCCRWLLPSLLWRRRGRGLWELGCRRGWQGWSCVCGFVLEGWERWRECRVRQSPMRMIQRLQLVGWGQASRLVVSGGVINGLRQLGVGASVKFHFLLLDKGAFTCPMPLVLSMDAAVWNFLPSTGVASAATVGVASVAPLSSIVLRPGVVCFVVGDRIHGLRGLCLLGFVWSRSIAVMRLLLVLLFESYRLPLSEMQYSCIISKSMSIIFGLQRSRYSLHGSRLSPATAASMMVFFATSGALTRSLTRRCRYSCKVKPPCFRLWKSHELISSCFGRNAKVSSARSWSQARMCPFGRFRY